MSYMRKFHRYFQAGLVMGYGTDIFQQSKGNGTSSIGMLKVQKSKLGFSLGSNLYKSKELEVKTRIEYFQNKFQASEDSSLKVGSTKKAGLEFIFPIGTNEIGTNIFIEESTKNSDTYELIENTNGALIFYNIGF